MFFIVSLSFDVKHVSPIVGDGDTIIVEIPGVTWRTNTHRSIGRGLIRSYEYKGGDGSGFLALATKGPVTVKNRLLSALVARADIAS